MENSGDQFDVLADISLPELQHTQQYSNIADGPFAVEFGDHLGLGAQLTMGHSGTVRFLLNSGVKYISREAEVSVDKARQTISFTAFGLTYLIRPLTKADQKAFFPGLRFTDMDEFKDYVGNLAMRILGSTADPTEYAITTDGDQVLGLFQRTSDGFARREKKSWVPLSKDDAGDWDDIDDKLWTPVLSGAVSVYDQSAGLDSIAAELFTPYIAN